MKISTKIISFVLLQMFTSQILFAAEADYDALIQQSLVLRNAGKFQEAEAILRQARELAAESSEVDFLLAMAIAFQERYLEANRILDTALQRYPDDVQLVLGKARVLSYQGFYREAIAMADRAIQLSSQSLDALNLIARVSYYQRRLDNARTYFNQVLAIAPDNLEALIGLYDTEMSAGNDEAAGAALELAERVAPGHIDVVSRQQQAAQPLVVIQELSANFAVSDLDRPGFQKWYDRSLEYRYRNTSGNQYYLRTEHAHRFGLHDSLVEAGTVIAGQRRSFTLALTYTPDAEILPEYRVRVGSGFVLNQASDNFGSTLVDVTLANSSYITGDVQILNLDFTHYLLNANAWLTPGIIFVSDESGEKTTGWKVGAHWQAAERFLLGFNFYDTAETDLNITTQTRTQQVYFRFDWFDALSVRLDLSRNRGENSYTRESAAIGVSFRF